MSRLRSSLLNPERTLAIVCGAEEWPHLDNFESAPAFANSAKLIRSYLESEQNLGLAPENVLWLFGMPGSTSQYQLMTNFLQTRFEILRSPRGKGILILFFYVGHGAFFGQPRDYCLLVQDTRGPLEADTSLRVASLARLFRMQAPDSSRVLFLDCCFAGEAARLFMGTVDQAVSVKAHEVVEEAPTDRGVALLCASSARNPASMESPTSYTLFGRQLISVLTRGDANISGPFSLRHLCDLIRIGLRSTGVSDPPNPELHIPVQIGGDLGARPLFPNPAWDISLIPKEHSDEEARAPQDASDREETGRTNTPHGSFPKTSDSRITSSQARERPLVDLSSGLGRLGSAHDSTNEAQKRVQAATGPTPVEPPARLLERLASLDEMTERPSYLERLLSQFNSTASLAADELRDLIRAAPPSNRPAFESAADDFVAAADSIATWARRQDRDRSDARDINTWRDLWRNFRAAHRQLVATIGFPGPAEVPRDFDPAQAQARLSGHLASLDEMTERPSYLERLLSQFNSTASLAADELRDLIRAAPPSNRPAFESAADDFVAAADSIATWARRQDRDRSDARDINTWRDLWRNFRAAHRQLVATIGFPGPAEVPRDFDPAQAQARLSGHLASLDEMTERPSYLERLLSQFNSTASLAADELRDLIRAAPPSNRPAFESAADDFVAAADSIATWARRQDRDRSDARDINTWRDLWRNFRAAHRQLVATIGEQ